MEVKLIPRTKPVPRGMMCLQYEYRCKLVYTSFGLFMTGVVLMIFVD